MKTSIAKKLMAAFVAIFALLISSASVFGQNRTVQGRILDEKGVGVSGAYVIIQGTNSGVPTDLDGNFTAQVPAGPAVLEISCLGYEGVTITVAPSQSRVDVVLKEDAELLEDAVVIGYGVQNRRDVTTSIASIKSEDFAERPLTDFREAMAAKMPGVQVTTLGGQPDGNISVRVRGIQSITSGNDPLYVIDGVPCDSRAFANLDASDIESIEVLKDASSAAIYGSRGSCGVVLVTTKKGKSENTIIHYDGQLSVASVAKREDLLDAYEFVELFKEARNGSYLIEHPTGSIGDPMGIRGSTYNMYPEDLVKEYATHAAGLVNTDWQDEIFRTAFSQKHALSISGKSKSASWHVSGNYLNREGTIINSNFTRYSVRANVDGNKGRFKYGMSIAPSYSVTHFVNSESNYGSDGVIVNSLVVAPIFPVYNDNGLYNWDMTGKYRVGTDYQYNVHMNPVALVNSISDVRQKMNIMGNAYGSYEFIKGLVYRISVGGDFYSYNRDYYKPSTIPTANMNTGYAPYDPENGLYLNYQPNTPTATAAANQYFHWNVQNQLSFDRKFGDHNVKAVAAYEAELYTNKTMSMTGIGNVGDDKIQTLKGKTYSPDDLPLNNISSYSFASWLVRAQYSYKGRYMLSASIRGDGSSRFAPKTRWGYFPAVSVGWRISDEPFMRRADWISDMKLRASVGRTGNAQIGNSEYLALYGTGTLYVGNGSSIASQVYPSQIENGDLGWEKNTQYDAGIDATFWKGLLGLTIDGYYSKTTDMLFEIPVPSVSGLTTSNMNIGAMQNVGLEISLSSRKQFASGFFYDLSANWSLNRNKVLHTDAEDAPIIKPASYAGAYYITEVGQPVGCYYLLKQCGVFHNQEELDSYPHFLGTGVDQTQVGDFKFVDANGDGILSQTDDRVIVGNYMPDFFYGFGFTVGYKGFDVQANFQGVYGNEILNLERRYICNMEASSNMMKLSLQRYPYGELNRATRKSSGKNGASTNTFHIEDGSYLRCQSLSVGYTMPDKWFRHVGVNKFRVYLQASNLFTFTNYTGFNPEVNRNSSDALRPGEDYGSYPIPRTFTFGLNFNL